MANINTRVVTSKFDLDLILLTHTLDHLILTDRLKNNLPQKIKKWAESKHNLETTVFDELKLIEELNLPENHESQNGLLEKIKLNINQPITEEQTHLNHDFSKNLYKKLALSDKKINQNFTTAQLYQYDDTKNQGYIIIETDFKKRNDKILNLLGTGLKKIDNMDTQLLDILSDTFIGSKSEQVDSNVYSIPFKLKGFSVEKHNGKFEVRPEDCSSKVKNDFNMFIQLHDQSDYLYVINGKHLTEKKMNNLKSKNLKLRVEPRNFEKLETYLHISRLVNAHSAT